MVNYDATQMHLESISQGYKQPAWLQNAFENAVPFAVEVMRDPHAPDDARIVADLVAEYLVGHLRTLKRRVDYAPTRRVRSEQAQEFRQAVNTHSEDLLHHYDSLGHHGQAVSKEIKELRMQANNLTHDHRGAIDDLLDRLLDFGTRAKAYIGQDRT